MTSRPSPALLQALALFRAPRGARPGPDDRLPQGVELLIRIAAGDAQALDVACRSTGEPGTAVRDAAAFYIQQVMFAADSHSYRVLGLDEDATEEQLKSHHRWLTRWLHPDRNRDEWEAVYSERVNRAWQDLRNSERRQQYDRSRAAASGASPSYASRSVAGRAVYVDGGGAGWSLRWLPHLIFGGLGISAVVFVALYYVLRMADPAPIEDAAPTQLAGQVDPSALADARIAQGMLQESVRDLPQVPEATSAVAAVAAVPVPVPAATPAPTHTHTPEAAALPASPSASVAQFEPVTRVEPVKPSVQPPVHEIASPTSEQRAKRNDVAVAKSAPASVATIDRPDVREAPRTAPISQREANRILGRFVEVYEEGNVDRMRAMFTADASSPDGGLEAILGEYDRLFESTKHRSLSMSDVAWSASGDTFSIQANYDATVKSWPLRKNHSQGRLHLDLRQENDQWRIFRIEHNERPD